MTDLTEFLLARLDDDEAAARAVIPGPWEWAPSADTWPTGDESVLADWAHIARHDPTRVLADCAARRAVVDALVDMRALLGRAVAVGRNPTHMRVAVESYEHVVRCLAAVYDSHPDYDERWRP